MLARFGRFILQHFLHLPYVEMIACLLQLLMVETAKTKLLEETLKEKDEMISQLQKQLNQLQTLVKLYIHCILFLRSLKDKFHT